MTIINLDEIIDIMLKLKDINSIDITPETEFTFNGVRVELTDDLQSDIRAYIMLGLGDVVC